jgi:hypothetical protein
MHEPYEIIPNESCEDIKDLVGIELLEHYTELIGMGKYQWHLFFLCGCGWAAE